MLVFIAALMIASFLDPVDPAKINMSDRLLPISSEHFLGTDHMGRDLFSRILAGAQSTVGTAFLVLFISFIIGLPIGLIAGYAGGITDRFFMRIADAFMAFPDYIIAIILTGLIGPGLVNLIMAIVMVKWVGYSRLVRSVVISEKEKDYVQMAKINGASSALIIRKHLLPHVLGHLLVMVTLDIGKVILMIASLSYIGLGPQPPSPEWGAMLNESKAFFYNAPQLMIIPGLAIMLVVLVFNLMGDQLRDKLDVKNR
ncbi:nickel transporter permease [Metabacillus sp. FJAT-52054]|uniref:Nickel transporter permease n=1 Tax=Metabacillus sediminis TaxID=3117746 RepID=A0ABZ2NP86_9BACI